MGQVASLREDLREAEVARKHAEATAVSAREAAGESSANARRAERRVKLKPKYPRTKEPKNQRTEEPNN